MNVDFLNRKEKIIIRHLLKKVLTRRLSVE